MKTFLATFVVTGRQSDTEAINSAVSMLEFIPLAQAANMHVFLIRSEKTREQLAALLTECLDPNDYCCVVEHPDSADIALTLRDALKWVLKK
ncbi:MAG: hypothetical protein VCA73_20520 [Roseibacillus sp.]|jgi:3-methyladenine DNA glycosylase AlkC